MRAPSDFTQRSARKYDSGESGSQSARRISASGASVCRISAHRTPCWLSRASMSPSLRNDFVRTSAGKPCFSFSR